MGSEAEEAAQEAALKAYKDQLAQVELTMRMVEGEEEKEPLRQLANDLKELIQISEDSLFKLKRDNLMTLIGEGDGGGGDGGPTSSGYDIFSEDPQPVQPSTLNEPNMDHLYSTYSKLLGTPCRAPFPPRGNGSHNAIVHALDSVDEEGRLQVKVLYTHPQEPRMVTCKFFLDDRCNFDDQCRKNHGYSVDAADLRDYEDPDYSTLQVSDSCLAKHGDDGHGNSLWTPAEILHLEEGLVTVQIKSVNKTLALPFADIFPTEDLDDEDDEGEDLSDEEPTLGQSLVKEDEETEDDVVREIKVNADLTQFGNWEKNTRGIGTRILEKWGYVKGTGLGKDGEGRVIPVEAKIFPQGKSLDICMAMRLQKETGEVDPLLLKKRQKRKENKKEKMVKKGYTKRTKEEEGLSAFSLINSIKLTKKGGDTTVMVDDEVPSGSGESSSKPKHLKSQTANKSSKDLRVQMLQTEGELTKVGKELERVNETIMRNDKKNPPVATQAREKKKDLEKYRDRLKASLKTIQSEQKNRGDKKKMAIF